MAPQMVRRAFPRLEVVIDGTDPLIVSEFSEFLTLFNRTYEIWSEVPENEQQALAVASSSALDQSYNESPMARFQEALASAGEKRHEKEQLTILGINKSSPLRS